MFYLRGEYFSAAIYHAIIEDELDGLVVFSEGEDLEGAVLLKAKISVEKGVRGQLMGLLHKYARILLYIIITLVRPTQPLLEGFSC